MPFFCRRFARSTYRPWARPSPVKTGNPCVALTQPPALHRHRAAPGRPQADRSVALTTAHERATTRGMPASSPRRARSDLVGLAVLVATGVFLLAFAGWPLLAALGRAFGLPERLTFGALATLADPGTHAAMANTLAIALGATLIATLLGTPLAFLVVRTNARWTGLLAALATLPLAVPPYLLAMAFRGLWHPRIGLLGAWLAPLGIGVPVEGRAGIAVVLGVGFMPFVFLRVRAALSNMDASLEEAARTAGASAWTAMRHVTLPLVRPSIASGAILVFLAASAAFGVPALLGMAAEPRVFVLTTRIYTAINVGTDAALAEALGLSAVLALAATGLVVLSGRLSGRAMRVVTGKAARPSRVDLGKGRVWASAGAFLVLGVLFLGPLAALITQSLTLKLGQGPVPGNLGFAHLFGVLRRSEVPGAMWGSLWLAGAAAALCIIAGTAVSLVAQRKPHPLLKAMRTLGEVPYALPGTIVALALVLAYAMDIRVILGERLTLTLALGGSSALLLIAYVVKYLAFGLRSADEALGQIDPSLEEAARLSGAGPARAFADTTLALLRPQLAGAFVAVFLPLLSEITMSVLLISAGTDVLGTVLFGLNEYGDPQQAMALATWLVLFVLALQAATALLKRRSHP